MFKMLVMFSAIVSLVNEPYLYTTKTVPVEPGTYPVVVYYDNNGKTVSTISKTTIGSSNFISIGDIAIDANDIYTTKEQELTSQFLLTNSKVKAWNKSDNVSYNINKISVNEIDNQKTEVTFETINEVSTTINVYIVDDEKLYSLYSSKSDEKFTRYYMHENYFGFLFVLGLVILFIVAVWLFISAQIKMKKQMNHVMKIAKK